jgi:hypothetical protein
MKKIDDVNKVILVIFISFALLMSCSKANTPFQIVDSVFTVITTYRTHGYPFDFGVTEDFVFVAEDQLGFSYFDRNTGGDAIHRISSFISESDFVPPEPVQFRQTRFVRTVPELNYLLVRDDNTGNSRRFFYANFDDSSEPINLLWTRVPLVIHDLYYELIPNDQDEFYAYWCEIGTGFIDLAKYKVKVNPGMWDDIFEEVNRVRIDGEVNAITGTEDYLILALGQIGIHILTNDESMSKVAEAHTGGDATDIVVHKDHIYVATQQMGLRVIDLKTFEMIPEATRLTSGNASSLDVCGDLLAVGTRAGGLYLFDISTPYNPTFIERITAPELRFVYKVKFFQNDLYVACRNAGVVRYRISR